MPGESHSYFNIKGRESRSDIFYDWGRRTVKYDFRGETFLVRRKRHDNERADDVQDAYRAELAPFSFLVAVDPRSGERTARFDIGRFSSWAKPDHPATITFGADGNPERMAMEMILGTSVRMGFARSGA